MKEIWKDIVGYEGKYMISNMGNVKSLNYKRSNKEKILKPFKNKDGYLIVGLCINGKKTNFQIHRLVAEIFIPNPNNLPQVNHKDENKLNNSVDNLEWCSVSYNINYGNRNDKAKEKLYETIATKIYPNCKQVYCIELNIIFQSISEASKSLCIDSKNISACCNGKRKTAGGYHWKYVESKTN